MKTPALVAAIAVPLVLAYPVTSWILGQEVESTISAHYKPIESVPYLKIVERNYQRGVFSATEVVTFEVMGHVFRAGDDSRSAAAAPATPLRFTIRSQIHHGPLPGLAAFAAATADSEISVDGTTGQELAKMLGDKKPLTAHTVYAFDGGGSSVIVSPAMTLSLPGGSGQFVSGGVTARVEFTKDQQSITMTGDAPKLAIQSDKGVAVTMTGLKFDSSEKRIFDDEPLLHSGTQRVTLDQLSVADASGKGVPVQFDKLVYEVAMPIEGEFLDLVAKMGVDRVLIGDQNYGPVHYDFSLRHLHARATAGLYRAFLKLYADPETMTLAATEPARAFATLKAPGLELLKYNPQVRIDRLSFRMPQGEAAVAVEALLRDPKAEDMTDPINLIAKLEVRAELALPEALLGSLLAGQMRAAAPKELTAQDIATMQAHMLEERLAALADQGFITRTEGVAKTKLEFRGSQLSVNGKPFNPMSLRAPPPAAPVPEKQARAPARRR